MNTDHITNEANQTRKLVSTEFQTLQQRANIEKVLNSLKFPDMNSRVNQRAIDADENTLHWIFNTEENEKKRPWDNFPSWLASNENLYWINGKPGSGKSTLMKRLISEPRTMKHLELWSSNPIIVSYFLWNSGSPMQRSLKGLLSSLVYQMLEIEPEIINSLVDQAVIRRKEYLADWSETELERFLFQCIVKSSRAVGLFLDGLDEIDRYEGSADLINLIYTLSNFSNMKVCVSSRPEREFIHAFKDKQKMRLQDLTENDIRIVVTAFLEKHQSSRVEDETNREEIVKLVLEKANGVFLWVHLALNSLQRGNVRRDDLETIKLRLEGLPSKLEEIYQAMWRRLGDDENLYRREAAIYFNLVSFIDNIRIGTTIATLFLLSFSISRSCQGFLKSDQFPYPNESVTECERHKQRIEDCGAGFLELQTVRVADFITDKATVAFPRWIRQETLRINKCTKTVGCMHCSLERLTEFCYKTRVQFIHRSAADFLRDTKEGREILASDRTNIEERSLSVYEAVVFACISGVGENSLSEIRFHKDNINYIKNELEINNSLSKVIQDGYHRLLQELELLNNSRLGGDEGISAELPQKILELMDDWIRFGIKRRDAHILQDLVSTLKFKGYSVTDEFKSHILFVYCDTPGRPPSWVEDDLILWLLRAGADPNYTVTSRSNLRESEEEVLSSFELYLTTIYRVIDDGLSSRQIEGIYTVIREFIDHGANLSNKIFFFWLLNEGSTLPGNKLIGEYTPPIWEINTAQLVQKTIIALQHASSKLGPLNSNLGAVDGLEGQVLHRKLLLVNGPGRLSYSLGSVLEHASEWYTANEVKDASSKKSFDGFVQLMEKITFAVAGPHDFTVDEVEKMSSAIQHCVKVPGAKTWLQSQGFRFRSRERMVIPEPFQEFKEVYGYAEILESPKVDFE